MNYYTKNIPNSYPTRDGDHFPSKAGYVMEDGVAEAMTKLNDAYRVYSTAYLVEHGGLTKDNELYAQRDLGIDLLVFNDENRAKLREGINLNRKDLTVLHSVQVKYQPLTHAYGYHFNVEMSEVLTDKHYNVLETRPCAFGKAWVPDYTVYVFTGRCVCLIPTKDLIELATSYKKRLGGDRYKLKNDPFCLFVKGDVYTQKETHRVPVSKLLTHPKTRILELSEEFVKFNNKLSKFSLFRGDHPSTIGARPYLNRGQEWTGEQMLQLAQLWDRLDDEATDEYFTLLESIKTNGTVIRPE